MASGYGVMFTVLDDFRREYLRAEEAGTISSSAAMSNSVGTWIAAACSMEA